GKKILDIGCGPCGSLEWADRVSVRVGLDILADSYRKLASDTYKMQYVAALSEQVPFPDEYFDVISSFNSLDHVDNLEQTVNEIIRVIAPGGLFLLLTEVNHAPTVCEPQQFSWDVTKLFSPRLKALEEKHYENFGMGAYNRTYRKIPYNHDDKSHRPGTLAVKFIKI
ncbi:unnamed protein product, partial [marine sediment metagenome]